MSQQVPNIIVLVNGPYSQPITQPTPQNPQITVTTFTMVS